MSNQDRIDEIIGRLHAASRSPYRIAKFPEAASEEYVIEMLRAGSGDVWAVGLPGHPGTIGGWGDSPQNMLMVAVTGNGPTSRANAVFLTYAPDDIQWLLDRLDECQTRLRNLDRKGGAE